MGRGIREPLREGKVVMTIGTGDSAVDFVDSYVDYDEKAIFRRLKTAGDIVLEAYGSDMRVVGVTRNPGRPRVFHVVDD